MTKLEEILKFEDIDKKISMLKSARTTPQPNVSTLRKEWDADKHDVNNRAIRKERKVLIKEEYTDEGGVFHAAVYQDEDVNRISLPIEQDITNIHVSFMVGTDPTISYVPNDQKEEELYKVIKSVNNDNKIKYHNKRIVRSWLSETEIVEYWYAVKDAGFWSKLVARIKQIFTGNVKPQTKLKCAIWSPFRGDTLYPFFDETGDYVAQSREYKMKEFDQEVTYFQTVTQDEVFVWRKEKNGWVVVPDRTFKHEFPKLPCIYARRDNSLCHYIQSMRNRLEKLMSNYADCIDYHFFPYLILDGMLSGENGLGKQDERRRLISMENGGKAYYLTWEQTPETIRLEMDSLWDKIYSMTNTPRISFDNLRSAGQVASGIAFKYMFMGTHLAVENHAEVIGEFLQRRYNFLASAIGSICPSLEDAAQSINLDVEIVPYTIDNLSDKLDIVHKAIDAGLMSKQSAMIFVGLTDNIEEEKELIEEENKQSGKEPKSLPVEQKKVEE